MTKLLILLVLVLGILTIAQLARVYELTSRLRGTREEDISPSDNRMNGRLMMLFLIAYFGFFLWLVVAYKDRMLPISASEHGVETDWLMNFNWVILLIAFVLTNVLLFYFSYKYLYSPSRRSFWQPHNNKLELIWTIIPAAVLAVIIIYGLNTWNKITDHPGADALQVELYAKQFDWTARYPGADGMLGATDFRLINGTNPLGIATPESVEGRLAEIDEEIGVIEQGLGAVLPDARIDELSDQADRLRRHKQRILNLRTVMQNDITVNGAASPYLAGADDIVTKDFYLPLHQEVEILIRSRDVIHSVYIPHMRSQMNAVPGMTTRLKMVPIITTDSMRTHVMKNDAFDFLVLCNKICGSSHYNMQMPLIVTKGAEYDVWLAEQMKKPFQGAPENATADAAAPATQENTGTADAQKAPAGMN